MLIVWQCAVFQQATDHISKSIVSCCFQTGNRNRFLNEPSVRMAECKPHSYMDFCRFNKDNDLYVRNSCAFSIFLQILQGEQSQCLYSISEWKKTHRTSSEFLPFTENNALCFLISHAYSVFYRFLFFPRLDTKPFVFTLEPAPDNPPIRPMVQIQKSLAHRMFQCTRLVKNSM